MNNDNKQAPTPARDDPILRCGNINPLSLNEVFILYPGKTREFSDWLYHPVMKKAGVYRVAFSYANVPSMEWAGVPLGIHNPLAMLRVRQSTRCELESNEVILTVK